MTAASQTNFDVVIVGAGFAGLYALYRLHRAGLSTRVLEATDDVGGTWYANRYPGARCDVESMQYSYSFSEDLQQSWSWTERYATQPEIHRYLRHVADRFSLRPHIQFQTRITAAVYDTSHDRWLLTTDRDERLSTRFLVMASGSLSSWQIPGLPGLDSFGGAIAHTANWPTAGIDLAGKRVGVIGTGSSGIQAIPLIADLAEELVVFQRTPAFTVPARNHPLVESTQRVVKANYTELRRRARQSPNGFWFPLPTCSALEATPAERRQRYDEGWQEGGVGLLLSYDDLLTSLEANATLADFIRTKIRELVVDPATAEQLCPQGFPIGAKRLCVDTNYYATFNRPNVRLVDLRRTPITGFSRTTISTSDRDHPLDVVVFATGFDAGTGAMLKVDIRGRDGVALRDRWRTGPHTYLGVQSAGFPNLFMIAGPGSPSVLTNMVVAIEQHVEWIATLIEYAHEHDITSIEASDEAELGWDAELREAADKTLYPLANSWYMGANVPGKPRGFMFYAGGLHRYRERCEDVASTGYAGFALRGAPALAQRRVAT